MAGRSRDAGPAHREGPGLRNALREEGVDPETVDVRLAGSASEGFSGPHKPGWRASDDRSAGDPDAQARLAEWLGDDPERLRSRPFDSGYRLGVDAPSDYDVNISGDDLVARARETWEASGDEGEFLEGSHEYVNKEMAQRSVSAPDVLGAGVECLAGAGRRSRTRSPMGCLPVVGPEGRVGDRVLRPLPRRS